MVKLNFQGETHELKPITEPQEKTKGLGYCPACKKNTQSLPKPANGTCAICCNHQMKEQP